MKTAVIHDIEGQVDGEEIVVDEAALNKAPGKNIKILRFNEIELGTEPRYLVHRLIPLPGLSVIWGPPKSGKSFFAFDMLLHVALGWLYRGQRVQRGPVVYCAFEGASGLKTRVEAFRQNRLNENESKADIPFYLVPVTLDLVNDHRDLIESIRIALRDKNPLAVCLDTLNRSIAGSESKDKDMTAYIRAADAIRSAFDCAVVIVHHCGIDGSRPRGHTSLTGAADAQIAVTRAKDGNVMATVECMKDGPDGDTFYSRLEQVVVGEDKDGEEITSCIVMEAEPMAKATPGGPRLSANQGTMLALFKDAMPDGLTQADWYEKARAAGIGVTRKATLTDCSLALKDKNLVYEFDGIWKLINR